MKIGKFKLSKKAVSPVIATLLMIAKMAVWARWFSTALRLANAVGFAVLHSESLLSKFSLVLRGVRR
jgi:hypothetical protein